jgi:hypothetical protein
MKNIHNSLIILIILCIILLSVVSVSIYRKCKSDTYLQYQLSEFNQTIVSEWLDALKEANSKKALFLASKMVSKSSPYVPIPYYYDMAIQNGINSNFFNPPFTMLDYLYWKDAYDISRRVKTIQNDPKINNIPKYFFSIIHKDIKQIKQTDKSQRSAFLFEIWENKQCDIVDKYLLFSEFMTQAGYDVQIIVLFSDIKKPPVHIIAEVRNENEVYSCDFFTGNFWNKSVKQLTADKDSLRHTWKQKWIKGLNHLLFKTELSAMNYRKINQQLHEYLVKDNNKDVPIIGLDPYKRMQEYKRNFYPNYSKNPKLKFTLGIEPFTMIKNSKYFPKKWLTQNKKQITE